MRRANSVWESDASVLALYIRAAIEFIAISLAKLVRHADGSDSCVADILTPFCPALLPVQSSG
jgi:hypothetical protein